MIFDFDTFAQVAKRVFVDDGLYTLDEVLFVFRAYFEQYEAHTGHAHPPIKSSQIARMIDVMPNLEAEDIGAYSAVIDAVHYPDIITKHFETQYWRCDWNINHFFTGRIRWLRAREAGVI